MTRYGALTVQFYSPALVLLGSKTAVVATFRERVNGEGEARITFVNDSDLSTLGAVGNIAWAWKTDALRTDTADGIVVCEPFTIGRRATVPGSDFLEISGPDLLSELKRYTIYRPLGEKAEYSTTISEIPRVPTTTTTNGAFSAGSKFIDVVASNSADKTREIRIVMNTSPATTHVTVVEDRLLVDVGGTQKHRLVLRDRLPAAVANGAAVEMRTRVVQIADTSGFRDGIEVEVTTAGGTHSTLMLDEPDNAYITLRDGLPAAVAKDAAIKAIAYTGKSTKDVKTVLTYATGWSGVFDSTYEGTAAGTVYQGGGETVYNILRGIADETGEFFRLRSAETTTRGPKRQVRWLRTNPAAGVSGTLRLVMPDDASMASDTANMNRAIMLRRPEFVGEYEPVTQLIPVAGDAAVTLFSCSTTAIAAAAADGFTVVRTGLGLYTPPYIDWTSQTAAIGTHQRRVTFSEVTIDGTGADQIQAAADKLLRLSIKYMKARRSTARTLQVECVSPVGIRPGDTVELYYQPGNGVYTLNYTSSHPTEKLLYVQEVERTVSNSGDYPGVPVTRLMLSPTPEAPEQGGNREAARRLVTVERLAAQVNTPRMVNISVPSPGGYAPPATLTATTPNETTGSGHTHQITAYVSSLSTPGQLVKTDGAGSVQFNQTRLRSLWIGNPDDATYVDVRQEIHEGIAYLVGRAGSVGKSEVEEV